MSERTNVVEVDFSDPTRLLQDDELWDAIRRSRHPACNELIHVVVSAVLSVRHTGRYDPPRTRVEIDDVIRAAVKVARRNIAKRRSRRAR